MIKPEEADADTRNVYDGVRKQWGRISAGAPAGRARRLDAAECGDPARQREIRPGLREDPTTRHHQNLGAQSQRLLHVAQRSAGQKVSLTSAQIEAAQGSDYMRSAHLDERQKAAIRWAETVTLLTARDDEDAFAAMRQHFSEKQIVELTVFCGMWNYSNRLCEALHIDLERPDKRIEFQHD